MKMLIEEELEFESENKVEEVVVDDTEEIDSEAEVEQDDGKDDDEDDDDADEEEEEDDDDDVQEVFQSSGSGAPTQPVEVDDDDEDDDEEDEDDDGDDDGEDSDDNDDDEEGEQEEVYMVLPKSTTCLIGLYTATFEQLITTFLIVIGEDQYLSIKSASPSGIDILHHIEQWEPDKQQKAYEIIADFERQGLDRLHVMPGALELCGFLDSRNIRRGLITRNVKLAVDLFHERFGMSFSPAFSREFRPYKPDPGPLLRIYYTWEVEPNEVMMIGDSLKDDRKEVDKICNERLEKYDNASTKN